MSRDKTELDMIKLVNAKRDYEEIGKYVISEFRAMADSTKKSKYNLSLTDEELVRIEKYLIERYKTVGQRILTKTNLSKDDILDGKASFDIYKEICIIRANLMTLKDELKKQEEETKQQEIEFKTKKKNKERKERIRKLAIALGLSSAIAIVGLAATDVYNDYQEDQEVTAAIGYIVSDEENDKRNIIEQNIYRASFDEKGKDVYDLNIEGLANDIITLCKRNHDLFDIAIYNVYTNLDTNKLSTMDSLIVYLIIYCT